MLKRYIRPIPTITAALGTGTGVASIIAVPDPTTKLACASVSACFLVGAIFYAVGRGKRDQRDKVLDKLGVSRAYATATEDNRYFHSKVAEAHTIRVLAINIEMLLRNMPAPFLHALKRGAEIQVILALSDSELVEEMEAMEVADGRPPGRSIGDCIREADGQLAGLLADAHNALPARDRHRLGKIRLGHFNTHYRESMIICDDKWVWWTPHLNPARGADRPTLVFEGRGRKLVQLCLRHFEAVERIAHLADIPMVAPGAANQPPPPAGPAAGE